MARVFRDGVAGADGRGGSAHILFFAFGRNHFPSTDRRGGRSGFGGVYKSRKVWQSWGKHEFRYRIRDDGLRQSTGKPSDLATLFDTPGASAGCDRAQAARPSIPASRGAAVRNRSSDLADSDVFAREFYIVFLYPYRHSPHRV